MTRVIQIDGAPGAGKTHRLKKKLQSHVNDGLGLHGFYWLTFTNAGRKDVEPELVELFPDADDDPTDRARTFHSVALSLLLRADVIEYDDVADVIIAPDDDDAVKHYEEFCAAHGLAFDPDVTDTRKLLSGDRMTEKTGNVLFAINDYLTQTCKPPEKWRAGGLKIRTPGETVIDLLDAWDDYKRNAHEKRLFEHGDYVAEAFERSLSPGVEVLLVDEFQDLAPVEYRLFKLWRDSGSIDTAYIAGDPNQAIYSFRGGTPFYFENTDVDSRITLKESFRCRAEIAGVANAVLSAHTETDPRGFAGRHTGGTARWRSLTDAQALRREVIRATDTHADADPSVFLLTRTRHQQRKLTRDLMGVGIPFELLGRNRGVWRGQLARVLAFLNNLKSGGSAFLDKNTAAIVSALPGSEEARKAITRKQVARVVDRDAVAPFIDRYGGPVDIVENLQLPAWKRDVLKNAVDAPASIGPEEVRVGTIHAAKGLEAPAVYLFADSTETATRRYSRDADHAAEEHRVYYVGATRASEELYLIRGYFGGPVAPPLKEVLARGKVAA